MYEVIENYGYVGEVTVTTTNSISIAYQYIEDNYSQEEVYSLHVGIRNTVTGEAE